MRRSSRTTGDRLRWLDQGLAIETRTRHEAMVSTLKSLQGWAPPNRHRTLAEHAFETLRDAILQGDLRAGQRLSIDELAVALDMSKMPIRDALRRLEAIGLVKTRPYRGTHVSETSVEDLHDAYRARLVVEPLALRCAAERFTAEDAAAGRRWLDELNRLPESASRELWAAHKGFHFSLYEASGSTWLPRVIQPLWEASERYRFATRIEPRSVRSKAEHERILQACIDRDPETAAIAHHDHLARTANEMAESMGAEPLFETIAPAPGD
jgi:DNA-binding GntR family transcriptional regulator